MEDNKEGRKANALMDQYPFIRVHHEELIDTHPRGRVQEGLKLSAKVKRADATLMFRKPDNVVGNTPGGGFHWIRSTDGRQATMREYGVFVNREEQVISFRSGTQTRTSQRVNTYFKDGLVSGQQVKYILWVRIYDWYESTEGGGPGPHLYTEVAYEVHLPPKSMTFGELVESIDLYHNVELTTRMMVDGVLKEDTRELYMAVEHRLISFAKRFEREVFGHDMAKIIDTSEKRGMGGNIGGVNVMSWVMCGRCMITLEAPNPTDPRLKDSFTLICNEPPGDPNMGYRSIAATADRAEELVNLVIKAWAELSTEERKQLYVDDKDVKLLGM